MVLSLELDARLCPLGEKVTELTESACPSIEQVFSLVERYHKRIVLSAEPEAKVCPFGEKEMQRTC